jgi:hypothetical protein
MVTINKIDFLNNDDLYLLYPNGGMSWVYKYKFDYPNFDIKAGDFSNTNMSGTDNYKSIDFRNIKYKNGIKDGSTKPDSAKFIIINDSGKIELVGK